MTGSANRQRQSGLMWTALVLAIIGTICSRAWSQDTTPAPLKSGIKYANPEKMEPVLGVEKLSLKMADRVVLAVEIGRYVRNRIDYNEQKQVDTAARLLRLALTLDPTERGCYVAHARLRSGLTPGSVAEVTPNHTEFAKTLVEIGSRYKAGKGEDLVIAAYLFALAGELDRANDDAIFELGRLKDAGIKVDWSQTTNPTEKAETTGDTTEKAPAFLLEAPKGVLVVRSLADGRRAVTGGRDGVVRLWNLETQTVIREIGRHEDSIWGIAISPDESLVATSSTDKSVRVWDLAAAKEKWRHGCPGAALRVAFSPDGKYLASGGFPHFTAVWEVATGKLTGFGMKQDVAGFAVAFSKDGSTLFTGGEASDLRVWSVGKWNETARWTGDIVTILDLEVSPDGELLAAGQKNGLVRVWSIRTGKIYHTFDAHPGRHCSYVTFSPDGRNLLSSGDDGKVIVWDVRKRREQARVQSAMINARGVAVFAGGRKAVAGDVDGLGRIIDLQGLAPVYLAELKPASVHTHRDGAWGFGMQGLLGLVDGTKIEVDGERSPNGLGTHPTERGNAHLVYQIDKGYDRFRGGVAINDSSKGSVSELIFEIHADGKSIWRSRPINKPKARENFDLSVKGVSKLDLLVHCPGGLNGAHAVWLEPRLFIAGAAIPEPTTHTVAVANPARQQSVIKGLSVRVTKDGEMMGLAADVILTINPKSKTVGSGQVGIVGDAGQSMKTSLEEAARLARLRHPAWPDSPLEISFQDKYSRSEGGSAGAAFAVLLMSLLQGFEIDPAAAVTGDIAVNGRILPVGGVAAKLRGGVVDKCQLLVIPADNATAFSDMVLLFNVAAPWETSVFSATTLDDMIALVRKDRSENLTKAIALHDAVRATLKDQGRPALATPQVKEQLRAIRQLAPNCESARYLELLAEGKQERRLSRAATLAETVVAARPILGAIFGGPDIIPQKDISLAIEKRMQRLNLIAHLDIKPLVAAILEYNDALADMRDIKRFNADDPRRKRLHEKHGKMVEQFNKLSGDRALLEKLTREGA